MFSGTTAFPGYAALLPAVGAALVIAAGLAVKGGSAPAAAVARAATLRR